ncbi:MAG: dTMP kinase [Longimonas sp.]|uniref:dTMP kinase n=1 Tax=Longimonas sp. TaxID=2039626 RepID=UPI0039767F1E
MFITFEGIDGSGKSTQAQRLADWLQTCGHTVETMRDPGSTPVAEQVRALLLNPGVSIDDRAELFLFAAARAQLVSERIRPALKRGAVVLCDRFYDSTTAYQGGGRGVVPLAWLRTLHMQTTDGLAPTRTYIIDVPVQEAAARRHSEPDDRLEQEEMAFHERVRSTYQALAAEEPERICLIDGRGAPEQIHTAIRSDLQEVWPHNGAGTPL